MGMITVAFGLAVLAGVSWYVRTLWIAEPCNPSRLVAQKLARWLAMAYVFCLSVLPFYGVVDAAGMGSRSRRVFFVKTSCGKIQRGDTVVGWLYDGDAVACRISRVSAMPGEPVPAGWAPLFPVDREGRVSGPPLTSVPEGCLAITAPRSDSKDAVLQQVVPATAIEGRVIFSVPLPGGGEVPPSAR